MKKRLEDEVIVAALISEGSMKGAAASLGCNVRTLHNRMRSPDFQELYALARGEIIRAATAKLQGRLCEAVDTLSDIMRDKSVAPQTRCNAATSILLYGQKYTESADLLTRLEAVEEAQRAVS